MKTLLVIAIGFLPSLLSLWLMRKTEARTRSRFRRAAATIYPVGRVQQNRVSNDSDCTERSAFMGDRYYLEGVGYLVGDISCKFNARSGYLRCAVNPTGPCEGCRLYQATETVSREKSSSELM
ncbi:hypothetical protein DP116_14545 [Brasilonema bromeliae SPC951]|uniref:Uncharacterized protein n=2 Tax=Bromeliae group (in: Brasilonema) TaxID=3398495 RepID=A0ABX1P871_9CYAN|nr:hypothetical protein [Brasilonema bromeliae SPC951]